jgi:hypothetical protein
MSSQQSNVHLTDLAAYVLEVLDEADVRLVESHLIGCASCQAEVADFAGLLPALAATDPRLALAEVTQPDRKAPLAALRRLPSRWRIPAGLVAAAVIAVVVGLYASAMTSGGGDRKPSAASTQSTFSPALVRTFPGEAGETVTVRVLTPEAGSEIRIVCNGDYPPPTDAWVNTAWYALWVQPITGDAFKVSSWPATAGEATYPAKLDIALDQVREFQLRTGAGTPISSVPR